MKSYLAILSLFLILVACKKDKLKGEPDILIGKWHWAYSIYEYDKCQQTGGETITINPMTETTTFQMEFFEKGRVKFYQNNVEIDSYRIVINYWGLWNGSQPFNTPASNFVIYLDNNKEQSFSGLVAGDSIITFSRPYTGTEPSCDDYLNYWGRTN